MSYDFSAEKEESFTGGKFIEPGITDLKGITKIEAFEEAGKTPSLKFTFEDKDGKTTDDSLYFSDAAKPYSVAAINHIIAVTNPTATVTGKTLTEVAKNLMKSIGNKPFRHRFTGKEIAGKLNTETGEMKKNWWKARIGRKFSNETIDTNPSKLKHLSTNKTDKGYKYDWEHLPVADTIGSNGTSHAAIVDDMLPF